MNHIYIILTDSANIADARWRILETKLGLHLAHVAVVQYILNPTEVTHVRSQVQVQPKERLEKLRRQIHRFLIETDISSSKCKQLQLWVSWNCMQVDNLDMSWNFMS